MPAFSIFGPELENNIARFEINGILQKLVKEQKCLNFAKLL